MGKIPTQRIPESNIPEQSMPIKDSNGFVFCSIYHDWIKGTNRFYKKENFTNMVFDSKEFSGNLTEIVTQMIPKLFQDWENLFKLGTKNYHCHPVPESKAELVKNIAEEIHQTTFNNEDLAEARIQWWYIGFKSNVRLIGLYSREEKSFYPMFIDHHHLIHESKFYNQPDFEKYAYCPITEYNKK